ncbi:unnamed protein product, partial [Iphiclides podalirius]
MICMQGEAEDELRLDDEMERVVWGDGGPPARLQVSGEPLRDSAAPVPSHPPPPYAQTTQDGESLPSTSDMSPVSAPQLSMGSDHQMSGPWSGSGSPRDADDRHVQFDGDRSAHAEEPLDDANDERRNQRNTRHHHPHKSRKYSLQESGRAGVIVDEKSAAVASGDEPLLEVDQDDLRSHRSDDPRALRRHKIQPRGSTVHVSRKDGGDKVANILPDAIYKKMYDHRPHAVFVQLDELLATEDGDAEWKETARWIKYEEDVEEGSARWGRPHVASLSFHSLLNLRRCLETGVVLLDLDEKDLPGVAYRVVESMVSEGLIEEDDKPVVMRSLLLRHKHVHDERFRFSIGGRKQSSYTSLQSLWMEESGPSSANGARIRCSLCSAAGACRRHSAHLLVRNPTVRV